MSAPFFWLFSRETVELRVKTKSKWGMFWEYIEFYIFVSVKELQRLHCCGQKLVSLIKGCILIQFWGF